MVLAEDELLDLERLQRVPELLLALAPLSDRRRGFGWPVRSK